jgi:hypothetical protein
MTDTMTMAVAARMDGFIDFITQGGFSGRAA